MITIKEINNRKDLKKAQQIRYEVFVIGQNVPIEDEVDEFEMDSIPNRLGAIHLLLLQ